MTDFSERQLDPSAQIYIRERLEIGKTFAHHLLGALDLDQGSVITYIPDDVSEESAHEFRSGGKLPRPDESTWKRGPGVIMIPTPNTGGWLTSWIRSFLGQSSDHVCIFEEWTAAPSDPCWVKQHARREFAAFVGDEVYYVARHSDTTEVIGNVVRWASSAWPGSLGALTTADPDDPVLINRDIDPGRWSELATQTQALVVGAYDAESYLIWSRRPQVG